MSPEERSRLESLDAALRSEDVREQIRAIVERVRAELVRKKEALMTWEPIPLAVFGRGVPAGVLSVWVFILRAGVDTGAERHPNSRQRMMSFEGSGDMQTGEPGQWQSNALVSDPEARWNGAGFPSHRTSGIGRWSAQMQIGRSSRFTRSRPRND